MLMLRKTMLSLALVFGGVGLTYAEPAAAQATRTWVSGVGDDANPCSRTAPCKTFAGAISKTAAGGEINCLDPGGFGGVTITKSISIICDYTEGGVLVAGTNGITVNAGATDIVFLSGLDMHGAGTGLSGVRFLAGGTLHVHNSRIRRFNGSNSRGVTFSPSGNSQLFITDTVIADNGGGTTGGILVQPTGTGSARVTLRNVQLNNNINNSLRIDATGNTGTGITFFVDRSQIVGSVAGINAVTPAGAATIRGMVTNSLIAGHSTVGIRTDGAGAQLWVGDTTITANATGLLRVVSSVINSFGTNRLEGNTTDGTFTPPVIPQE